MAVLPILIDPDPRLREISAPVTTITAETHVFVADLFETMYTARGRGIAAIQVGVPIRLFVTNHLWDGSSPPDPAAQRVFVNPEILSEGEERSNIGEGCLSIEELRGMIDRPARVTMRFDTLDGETVEEDFDGVHSLCVQHEIDHLNGILFTDYIAQGRGTFVTKATTS